MTETTGSTATPESGNHEGAGGAADETTSGKLSRRERRRANKAEGGEGAKKPGKRAKKSVFARMAIFYRQIIAELRKVVWPTRTELLQYTSVVVTFVVVMMLLVYGLDTGFAKAAFAIFG